MFVLLTALGSTPLAAQSVSGSGYAPASNTSPYCRITLARDSTTKDEAVLTFFAGDNKLFVDTSGDGIKMMNPQVNVWTLSADGFPLVINDYGTISVGDTIPIAYSVNQSGIYELWFTEMSGMDASWAMLLTDAYTHKMYHIVNNKQVRILINDDTGLNNAGRFKLIFWPAVSPMQMSLQTVESKKIQVSWHTGYELDSGSYIVERNANGKGFDSIGLKLMPQSCNFTAADYSFIDSSPVAGTNVYRIRRNLYSGTTYSNEETELVEPDSATLAATFKNASLKLYPVPVVNRLYVEGCNNMVAVIYNGKGEALRKYTSSANQLVIDMSDLASGLYYLQIAAGTEVHRYRLPKLNN